MKSDERKKIEIMEEGGKILARVIKEALARAKPGTSTWELDQFAEERILELGGEPGFKRVPGYCFATCININEDLVHGLPSKSRILREGDIVSIDAGVFYKGFHTDAAWTIAVGQSSSSALRLRSEQAAGQFLKTGEGALRKAIEQCREGNFVGDISHAIQRVVEGAGFNVIRTLVGHGVGRELHEPPQIPCFGEPGVGVELKSGMTLAIEVLYAKGNPEVEIVEDGWTVKMKDNSLSAIFENTVAVGKREAQVLTPLFL